MEEEQSLVRELGLPIYEAKGWMKLIGVLLVITGTIYAVTIIGIVVAWLPIWMGVLLFQCAGAAEDAQHSGQRNYLISSLSRLRTFFTVMGVVTLICLIGNTIVIFMFLGVLVRIRLACQYES